MLVLILVSMVMSHALVDLFALQKPGLNYLNFIVLLSRRRAHDVQLEVLFQSIKNKFHAQKNTHGHGVPGFNVMLPRPVEVQSDVFIDIKVTIRGRCYMWYGRDENTTAETMVSL